MVGEKKKRSVLFYLGVGCGIIALILVLIAVVFGILAYRWGKDLKTGIEDPKIRNERVAQLLGYDTLPDGYYPVMSMSMPFFLKLAILSDKEPDFKPAEKQERRQLFNERGLIYLVLPGWGDFEQQMNAFVEGRTKEPEGIRQSNFRTHIEETIRNGEIQVGDNRIKYVAQRGEIEGEGMEIRGIITSFMLKCPSDDKVRFGMWFGPDPSADTPVDKLDLTGTPADETEISSFLGHFQFCRGAEK